MKDANGNSLVAQRLGFRVLTAEGLGSIPTQATKMPQATQSKKKKKATLVERVVFLLKMCDTMTQICSPANPAVEPVPAASW